MKILSTNTGKPQSYELGGVTIQSSMNRIAQPNGIAVRFDRVEGDEFAAPKSHGIKEAVVYAFAAPALMELGELYSQSVEFGAVGENLTCDLLDESTFMIGDDYEVGDVRLRVSGPRSPCNRLNYRFGRADAMDLFSQLRRPGVYFEVVREGDIRVGDTLRQVHDGGGHVSVLDLYDQIIRLKQVAAGKVAREDVIEMCKQAVSNPLIPKFLQSRFQKFL